MYKYPIYVLLSVEEIRFFANSQDLLGMFDSKNDQLPTCQCMLISLRAYMLIQMCSACIYAHAPFELSKKSMPIAHFVTKV